MIIKSNLKLLTDKTKLYQDLVKYYFTEDNKKLRLNKCYNFELQKLDTDYSDFENNYYKEALKLFQTVYTDRTGKEKHDPCSAYVSNKDNYDSYIHNHSNVGGFTAVYYLTMPSGDGGELEFYDTDQQTLIYKHKPVEDDILIFNSSINHRPVPIDSTDFRICINLSITGDLIKDKE